MKQRNYFDDVGVFHAKFNLPVSEESAMVTTQVNNDPPRILTKREFEFRTAFLYEEQREFTEAHAMGDLARCADALADIVWVALGTAHLMGLPFDAVWNEVKRANYAKRPWSDGDPVKPRNVVGLEIVKPEGWQPPDIEQALETFMANFFSIRSV